MTTIDLPPQPRPDADTDGFWHATSEGYLALSRCQDCNTWQQPPVERCRQCGGPTSYQPVSGRGAVYSYIVVHHPAVPGFADHLPYVVGMVELEEQPGLRLASRIVGVRPDEVRIDQAVQAEIVALPGGDFSVPVFRPVDGT